MLALFGVALCGVGIFAWTSPRQTPQLLQRGVPVVVQATPWFDPGSTIFTTALLGKDAPVPELLTCSLTADGTTRELTLKADPEQLGSRVRGDVSLVPAVTVGVTPPEAQLTCTGRFLDEGQAWLMPTLPSVSAAPLSVVIAGVGCIGLGLLANPRAQGSRRT